MDFFDVLKNRHSVRAFKDKDIESDKLSKILEAANSAPSAGNLQAYEIVLVKDMKNKHALAEAAHGQDFLTDAPVVLVICANEKRSSYYGKRGAELYCINDASIAAAYIDLTAAALGLGSVWVGAFDEDDVRKIIAAPEYIKPVAIMPIGYPDEGQGKKSRRELKDLVHNEKI
jgi:nitroreductase